MEFEKLKEIIASLKMNESKTVYELDDGVKLFLHRPEKLGRSLKRKTYDPKKNFQIFMKKPEHKDFKPNHLRVLLDLHLKRDSDPKNAEKIFDVIEKIYQGADPLNFKSILTNLKFRMFLDSPLVNVCCAQLFMAEQDVNYTDGKIQPPRAFMMGYIRMIRTGEFEIDKLLWNSIRHAPKSEFLKYAKTLKDIQ